MASDLTFGELFKAKAIVKADLDAAAEAYIAFPASDRFAIGDAKFADLAALTQQAPSPPA